ncbi:PepSY domain-containing protein [Streptomyces sp. NPDC093795]|uniref:PepSY domain-containing protein n=1 Tax=Streptomyces sp. NPDC093795 TaxID=3366051 RepID=UPI00381677E9
MKRKLVIATATATVAALACGGTAVALSAGSSTSSGARDARITAVQAIDAAVKARPGTVISAELDDDRDSDEATDAEAPDAEDRGWEVVVVSGSRSYTVHVDQNTGRALGTDAADDDSDDVRSETALLKNAKVSARQAATALSSKGFVTSIDLGDEDADDRDRGWDATVRDARGADHDWDVDLRTGGISQDGDDDVHGDLKDGDGDDTDADGGDDD